MLGLGTALGMGAQALGGILSSGQQGAAEKRAQKQMKRTLGEQRGLATEQGELYDPYYTAGTGALGELTGRAGGDIMTPEQRDIYGQMEQQTMAPIEETPEYQWRTGQSEDAINKAMAARGLFGSSAAVGTLAREQDRIGAEMSGQRYGRLGDLYNLLGAGEEQQYGRLGQLANLGYGAAGQQAGALGNLSNVLGGYGQNMVQSRLNEGNIQANMLGNLGAMPLKGIQAYTGMNALNNLGGGQGGQGAGGQGVTQISDQYFPTSMPGAVTSPLGTYGQNTSFDLMDDNLNTFMGWE